MKIPDEISEDVVKLAGNRLHHSNLDLDNTIPIQQWLTMLDTTDSDAVTIPASILTHVLFLAQQQLWLSGLKVDKKLAIQRWLCRQSNNSCSGVGQQSLFDFKKQNEAV